MATITGTSENDKLAGTLGNDIIRGLGGDDLIGGGEIVTDDLLVDPWRLTTDGSDGDDFLDGGDGNDRIHDGGGENVVRAGAGDDEVAAGYNEYTAPDDPSDPYDRGAVSYEVDLGSGDDDFYMKFFFARDALTLEGGTGVDHATLNFAQGVGRDFGNGVTFRLVPIATVTAPGMNVTVTGIERITLVGTGFDDTLAGGALADNIDGRWGNDRLAGGGGNDTLRGDFGDDVLDGGKGADLMIGNAGDDTFIVNSRDDRVVEKTLAGIDHVLSSTTYALTANVENLTLTGTQDLSGTGNSLANAITGNAGDNRLEGLRGNDVLIGGAGGDRLDGGTGTDTASYAGAARAVVASLYNPAGNGGDAKGDTYVSVENLTGSSHADKLTGNTGANVLNGGAGADVLKAGSGNDTLYGGAGGDDLHGGNGKDVFVFRALSDSTGTGAQRDTILDFSTRDDRIDLSAIDAGPASGDQSFTFIGTQSYHGKAGELRYYQKGLDTFVGADVDGDRKSDFTIHIDKLVSLDKGDFLL